MQSLPNSRDGKDMLPAQSFNGPITEITSMSWNIAGVNNNPFEFWITSPDPAYDGMMQGVQEFLEKPENDVYVDHMFTNQMFAELLEEMNVLSISGLAELEAYWKNDYSKRKAISAFLKDKAIGNKRLASMPDRITSTINLQDGSACKRPTVINTYDGGSLDSVAAWWEQWKTFMFRTPVVISTAGDGPSKSAEIVCRLIGPISRSKYPLISAQEQAISIPLQILCLAILDAIFVHVVNVVAPGTWELVRRELCEALINKKASKIFQSIVGSYYGTHVIFIQEAAAIFVHEAAKRPEIHERFAILHPANLDGKRDQNSLIFVRRDFFELSTSVDVTQLIVEALHGQWVAAGDLLVVSIQDREGTRWLLASFHGDSNGLATQPTIEAIDHVAQTSFRDHIFLMGLDANTYSVSEDTCAPPIIYSVKSFMEFISNRKVISCWGTSPASAVRTTCSSRTYLQTQLHKATPFRERASAIQQNLRDWILSYHFQTKLISDVSRDNTGRRVFVDGMVLPSIEFPSDHAIVAARCQLCPVSCQENNSHVPNLLLRGGSEAIDKGSLNTAAAMRLPRAGSQRSMRETTLFDYWGIREIPQAVVELASHINTFTPSLPDKCACQVEERNELSLDEKIKKIEVQFFVESVTRTSEDSLDRKDLTSLSSSDRSIWTLFCSRPFSLICCKPLGYVFLAAAALLYLAEAMLNVLAVASVSRLDGQHFRFTALELRDGKSRSEELVASISSLGLLLDGCAVDKIFNTTVLGPALTISFPHRIPFNGWFFVTAIDDAANDPTRFTFERSDDGYVWHQVGPPPWVLSTNFSRVPLGRLTHKIVDLRPSWQWLAHWIAGTLLLSTAHFVALLFGLMSCGRRAVLSLVSAELAFACINFVIACNNSFAGNHDEQDISTLYWLMSFEVTFLVFVMYTEEHPFGTPLICGLVLFHVMFGPTIFCERSAYHPNNLSQYVQLAWTSVYIVMLALIVYTRYRLQRWVSEELVINDRQRYDALWREICSKEEFATTLRRLECCASSLCSTKHGPIRQRHRERQLPRRISILSLLGSRFPGNENCHYVQPPVTSLDQLFNQAACLDIFLRQKTEQLALSSDGLLLATSINCDDKATGMFRRVEDIRQDPACVVNWATLKSKERALEKIMRSYNYDVSRLLDCCRQRIVFDELGQLLRCLEAIGKDEELEVVRVKNSLRDDYDSRISAGFRNVTVNLRIHSDYTKRLGIETHICELQLNLRSYQELMVDETHDRYLIVRGSRTRPTVWMLMYQRFGNAAQHFLRSWRTMVVHALNRTTVHPIENLSVSVVIQGDAQPIDATREKLLGNLPVMNRRIELQEEVSGDGYVEDVESEKNKVLEEHFYRSMTSTTRNGGPALGKDHVLKEATLQTPLGSIWDISHPVAAALSKPRALFFILLLELLLVVNLGLDISLILENNTQHGYHFRFTALQGSNGSTATVPGISRLGLLYNGCAQGDKGLNHNTSISGPTYSVSFNERIAMNGWWFSTQNQSIMDRPVRYLLELSDDPQGLLWQVVGASDFVWTWSGAMIFQTNVYDAGHTNLDSDDSNFAETSMFQDVVEFDHQFPKTLAASKIVHNVIYILTCAALLVAGLRSETLKGRWILATCFFLKSLCDICLCTTFSIEGFSDLSFVPGVFCVIFAVLSFVFVNLTAKVYLRHWSGLAGVGQLTALAVHYDVVLRQAAGMLDNLGFFRNGGFTEGILFVLFSVVTSLLRRRSRMRAYKIVEQDQILYDTIWTTILEQDKSCGAVEKLKQCTKDIQSTLDGNIRQRGRTRVHSITSAPDRTNSGSYSPEDPARRQAQALGPLILDLDQLFAQAAGLNPFLKQKVQQWAMMSNGCFPVWTDDSKYTFEMWETIAKHPAMLRRVRWATPKKMKRAVEKLYRVYDCDVSKLLDCCRQSIYFEDLESLAQCLAAIAGDEEARLVRVNNRLHAGYDSRLSAGYRDVSVNLCIRSPDTRELGLETHICELQLIHVAFAKIKTEEGHKNYVSWRNQRGA